MGRMGYWNVGNVRDSNPIKVFGTDLKIWERQNSMGRVELRSHELVCWNMRRSIPNIDIPRWTERLTQWLLEFEQHREDHDYELWCRALFRRRSLEKENILQSIRFMGNFATSNWQSVRANPDSTDQLVDRSQFNLQSIVFTNFAFPNALRESPASPRCSIPCQFLCNRLFSCSLFNHFLPINPHSVAISSQTSFHLTSTSRPKFRPKWLTSWHSGEWTVSPFGKCDSLYRLASDIPVPLFRYCLHRFRSICFNLIWRNGGIRCCLQSGNRNLRTSD
jgi:hypothetical protein